MVCLLSKTLWLGRARYCAALWDHLRKAVSNCKHPRWAMDRMERRFSQLTSEGSNSANNQDSSGVEPTTTEAKTKGHIVITYTQGLCKGIKRICSKYGIQTHFRGNSAIKNILVSPKDKDPMEKKNGAIYWFQCGELACDEEYIGGTSRALRERFKEHLKDLSLYTITVTPLVTLPHKTISK